MKAVLHITLSSIMALSMPAQAQESVGQEGGFSTNPNNTLQQILQNLQNFGSYYGFDTNAAASPKVERSLINMSPMLLLEQYLYNTVLGAIPVNTLLGTGTQQYLLVSQNATNASYINQGANKPFTQPNSYTSSQGSISVSALMDQPTNQPDPVNQGILNILATPDDSNCLNSDKNDYGSCTQIYTSQVVNRVMGDLPADDYYYTFAYSQNALPQLNTNSLIGPLMYTVQSGSTEGSSAGGSGSGSGSGQQQNTTGPLTAADQGQLAANYIRYAAGMVTPLNLPSKTDYDAVWQTANNTKLNPVQRMAAQTTIQTYLASLRVYAAQVSVGYSNLYYILEKRMPQNQGGGNSTNTSQALSEFNMASWRLYNPAGTDKNSQWVEKVNSSSPETVQKEIAVLLAEMNYQLYLNRMQDERILLTNSMLLLQNAKSAAPSFSNGTGSTDSTGGSSSSTGSSGD